MRSAEFVARWVAAVSIGVGALGSHAAAADCLSDCSNAYQAATASCQDQYGAAGQEVQLQECLDAAQTSYGSCSDTCETSD